MALLKANTGIGTTNPISALHVIGDGLVTGVVTATTFNGQINAGVSTLGTVSATNLNVSGVSTLGIASATNLNVSGVSTLGFVVARNVNSSGIVTGSSFRPSSGYYQSANGTNAFYVYDGTGNVAFQGTIGASQVNNAAGFKVIGFAGTDITFESNAYVAGVTTSAGGFVGNLTGTATTATKLATPRTFEITGDIAASPVSFDGTGNVSLAATIQPNSVGLGTDTFGDYVQSISGTSNQITVTGGFGEGATPTISLPNNLIIPQDAVVTRDLQVNRNLNVDGNITIGGTVAFINVPTLTIFDPDIVLGYRTDAFGNDVSNDNTANHGGIAVASTEGTPLISLYDVGVGETNPATYKKIMWFKTGTFAGLGTDAWLFNYAVGIGSTQFPTGTRLAAGSVQFTENDLAVIRNISASGVVTASSGFVGNLTGTASTAAFATTAFNLSNAANITTGTINTARLSGTYNIDISGNAATATNAGVATYANASGISTSVIGGIASVTQLNVSGVSTLGVVTSGNIYSTGIVTALSFVGNLTGAASTASFATTAFNLNGAAAEALSVGFARSAGISTNLKGGVTGNVPYQSAPDTTTFVTNGVSGQVLLFNGSVPIWSNVSAASGAFGGISVRDEGVDVGTANSITTLNFVSPNLSVTATSGGNGIATITMADNLVGTALSISGISTFGGNVSVGSGITMYASTGIISATAFYGSGFNLTDLILARIEGIKVQNEGVNIAGLSSFTTLNFVGDYVNATGVGSTATITFSAPGFASTAGVSTNVIGGIGSITQLSVSGVSTLGITTFNNVVGFGSSAFFGDNDALNFGDGNDLKIFHNGANSFIQDVGTGNLFIDASSTYYRAVSHLIQNASSSETLATFTENSSVALYYDNVKTFETSGAGATVYGTLDATQLNVSGVSTFAGITTVTGTTLFTRQLNVSGVSTLGVTTTTNLTAQQLNVSGVSTFAGIATHTAGLFGTTASFTGIVTASSYRGDGSQLTGIAAGFSISTNTTNSSQYVPYATSFGSTTGFGATTLLVYNPSSDNLGIGTTNPLQTLHIQGNLLVAAGAATTQHITQKAYELQGGALSWEGSAGQLFSITNNLTSGSIFSVNDVSGIPSIDVNADGTVTLAPYADGNVGIATTLPTSRLHVIGGALITGVSTIGNFRMTPVGTGATVGGIGVTYYGDGSQLTGLGNTTDVRSTSLVVTGVSTLGITSISQLNVTGVSTFAGITTVTGPTLFARQLNVSGVITAVQFIGSASTASFATTAFNVIGSASTASFANTAFNVNGTANRVLYNSATNTTSTSSNLTFDGGTLGVGGTTTANRYRITTGNNLYVGNGVGVAVTNSGVTVNPIIALGYDSLKYFNTNSGGGGLDYCQTQIAIGYGCMQDLNFTDSGSGARTFGTNIVMGYESGRTISGAGVYDNTFNGTGNFHRNVIVGYQNVYSNNFYAANHNAIFGIQCGYALTTGADGNALFGYQAGYNVTTGDYNVFTGYLAGYSNATGNYNIGIGYSAGQAKLTGSNNIVIGYNRDVPTAGGNTQLVIGSNTDDWIVGNSSYNVGLGTTNPTSKLHVNGGIGATTLNVTGVSTFAGIATHTAGLFGTTASFTGIVTASSYRGDGSQLTGIAGGVSISTNTTNSNQYIPYATSFGSTIGLGATTLLVYNPSTTRLGIGTTSPQYNLHVIGDFAATSKSFVIDHPTKSGKKLRYASLEGPEQGVYVRGRSQETIIELPEYWTALVDENSITVNLTPIGHSAMPRVESINQNVVNVFSKEDGDLDYYYTIYAERKDIEKLVVEY